MPQWRRAPLCCAAALTPLRGDAGQPPARELSPAAPAVPFEVDFDATIHRSHGGLGMLHNGAEVARAVVRGETQGDAREPFCGSLFGIHGGARLEWEGGARKEVMSVMRPKKST